jgi:hypothetical protein
VSSLISLEPAMFERATKFDIRREGHYVTGGAETMHTVPSMDMVQGKLFASDEERLYVLALLLESVGIDVAVRIGPASLWRDAIAELAAPQSRTAPHFS